MKKLIITAAVFCAVNSMATTKIIKTAKNCDKEIWVESTDIKCKHATNLSLENGHISINGREWQVSTKGVKVGDILKIRVKSSKLPNDITMCQLTIGTDTMLLAAQTRNFYVEPKTGQARNINLGISGPNQDAIGGPSANAVKYNLSPNPERGSAVRRGLIPDVKPLFNAQVRDTEICLGGDGRYYLTGSTGADIWHFNDGVELWVSDDLKKWDYLGLVFSIEKDGTWEKRWKFHHKATRALWAPEIHYVKGNYFITLSMPPGGRGLLKSSTGKPEGPYVNALGGDCYWPGDIDGSLFEDEDGTVYYLYGGGMIAKMKDDMSGLAEEPIKPILLNPDTVASHHATSCSKRRNCTDIGHEGAFMFKRNGLYYLTAADSYEGRYSSMAAISENIYGPYRMRHEAVPCGGGTGYFKDKEGQWWCSFFGNDSQAPFREKPAIVKVGFRKDGTVYVVKQQ